MQPEPLVIQAIEAPDGTFPFQRWYRRLSAEARTDIDVRLERVRKGDLGDHRALKRGLMELRIHHGPGLRIYGGVWQGAFFLLAWGGEKKRQDQDIEKATALWSAFTKARSRK